MVEIECFIYIFLKKYKSKPRNLLKLFEIQWAKIKAIQLIKN